VPLNAKENPGVGERKSKGGSYLVKKKKSLNERKRSAISTTEGTKKGNFLSERNRGGGGMLGEKGRGGWPSITKENRVGKKEANSWSR